MTGPPDAVAPPEAPGDAVTPATGPTGRLPGPLSGLLVLDLCRVLAGPFATMLLADLGARVVKVERPGTGDDSRGYGPFVDGTSMYFQRVNRGKQSIALDLRAEPDRQVLFALVDRADVLVENFRPGVMARLGLGFDALSARNPRLVYASVSGFGQTGPWRARAAYDAVVQAMAGVMSITGFPDGPPTKAGIPVSDLTAGLYAFGAVTAALLARERTGRGACVDVAMFDATLTLLENPALRFLATGQVPPRIGNAHFAIAPFDSFRCADRDILICVANDALFRTFCATVGRPDLAADSAYADNAHRDVHRDALHRDLEPLLAARSADEWLARLEAAGVPCAPITDVGEAITCEQARVRNMVIQVGDHRVPGNPMKFSGYSDPPTRPAAPALDADGAAIRAELGL